MSVVFEKWFWITFSASFRRPPTDLIQYDCFAAANQKFRLG